VRRIARLRRGRSNCAVERVDPALPRITGLTGSGMGDGIGSVAQEVARARAQLACRVMGVVELARFERETAATDAGSELIAQVHQQSDLLVESRAPQRCQPLPVLLGRRGMVGERGEGAADFIELQPDLLRSLDEREPAQHAPLIPPLVAIGPLGLDQPVRFVEAQRGVCDPRASRDVADTQQLVGRGVPLMT